MTRRPRLLRSLHPVMTLALAAVVLLAACGGTPAPTTTAPPTRSSTTSASANPSAETATSDSSSSTSACPAAATDLDVTLVGTHGRFTSRVPLVSDGSAPADPDPVMAGELVGTRGYEITFAIDTGATDVPVAVQDVTATLTTIGGTEPADAAPTSEGTRITLPDGVGPTNLVVDATVANDTCPRSQARAIFTIERVPASAAATCPDAQEAYIALLTKLDSRLKVGSVVRPFENQAFEARFAPAAGSDSIPLFAGFDPAAPAMTIVAAKKLAIASAGPALALTGADVETWRRSDVVGSDGTLLATPKDRIDWQPLAASSGTVRWLAPGNAGRYVIAILPRWLSTCMTGQGYVYLSVTAE